MRIKIIKRKRIILLALLIICIGAAGFWGYISYKIGLIPNMTFDEMLTYTTKDNEEVIITVGIIKDGEISYTVYGNNAAILPKEEHLYEIGSLTKTFTAALLSKAVSEGRISLSDQIDQYLDLPQKAYYPTMERLVTHTSGYKGYYFEGQMVSNFLKGRKNDFYGINEAQVIRRLEKLDLENKNYSFKYSNFGFAVIGSVLSKVYDTSYHKLIEDFVANDLKLKNTYITDGTGNLKGYWSWRVEDAYLSAGALTSTITDMLEYINLNMSGEIAYLSQGHQRMAELDATSGRNEKMNIRLDAAGMGWVLDSSNNIIWHNGGTSNFNSYAAFDKDHKIGVVILSNCPPGYRIPSTVMGVRLMRDLQRK